MDKREPVGRPWSQCCCGSGKGDCGRFAWGMVCEFEDLKKNDHNVWGMELLNGCESIEGWKGGAVDDMTGGSIDIN